MCIYIFTTITVSIFGHPPFCPIGKIQGFSSHLSWTKKRVATKAFRNRTWTPHMRFPVSPCFPVKNDGLDIWRKTGVNRPLFLNGICSWIVVPCRLNNTNLRICFWSCCWIFIIIDGPWIRQLTNQYPRCSIECCKRCASLRSASFH